jgi:cytochrome c biogenesis protein CcmG/thiol:disulfide interchange protein DsbE
MSRERPVGALVCLSVPPATKGIQMASLSAAEPDDARKQERGGDATDSDALNPDVAADAIEPPFKPSVFRTRVIPVFAIVMVVGLLALLGYAMFAPEDARVGQHWIASESGYLVPDDDMDAPNFTAVTFDGREVKLSDLQGKIVVLNFWASWCPPCRSETPLLQAVQDNLGDDVVLLGMNSGDTEGDARDFMNEYGVTYDVARDVEGEIALDYGVTGMPETFIIDPDGHYAVRYLGEIKSLEQLRGMVAEAR